MRIIRYAVFTLGAALVTSLVLATSAQAANLCQANYNTAKLVVNGKSSVAFPHYRDPADGTCNINVLLTKKYSINRPRAIYNDCRGLQPHDVGKWLLGRKSMEVYGCAGQLMLRPNLPRDGLRKRYRMGFRQACRFIQDAAKRGYKRKRDRYNVPCNERDIHEYDGLSAARNVLIYRRGVRGKGGRGLHSIALTSDRRLVVTLRNGFSRTYPDRFF